jgi:3-hydroxybutyryl-CoA dehydrogenase
LKVERVVVVGAGTMGAGIAQVAAAAGCEVSLVDVSADAVRRGVEGIGKFLDRGVAKGKISEADREATLGRISGETTIDNGGDAQLAVEAVVESIDVKRKVFASLEKACPATAVLATNTSSLRVSEIAKAVADSGRVVGMHFFNPAPLLPLVEVIAADQSRADAIDLATQAAVDWGKVAVRAKDTPGFIVNRVARGFYLEALRMLGEGVAGVEAIDSVMRTLGHFKMGPFQLMDLVGLDVNYAVSCSVYEQSGRPARLAPHEIQRELVEKGHLGRKSGRGLYRYDSPTPTPDVVVAAGRGDLPASVVDCADAFARAAALCDGEIVTQASATDRYIFARILATIMNEAAMTLDDEVATAADIDTAMQRGTNYPLGPLVWADRVSPSLVGDVLRGLNAQVDDDRFRPAALYGG